MPTITINDASDSLVLSGEGTAQAGVTLTINDASNSLVLSGEGTAQAGVTLTINDASDSLVLSGLGYAEAWSVSPSAFSLSAGHANLSAGRVLAVESATLSLSAAQSPVSWERVQQLYAQPYAAAVSAADVTSVRGLVLVASSTEIVLTGFEVYTPHRHFSVELQTLLLEATSVSWERVQQLYAQPYAAAVSAADVTSVRGLVLVASSTEIVLTGFEVYTPHRHFSVELQTLLLEATSVSWEYSHQLYAQSYAAAVSAAETTPVRTLLLIAEPNTTPVVFAVDDYSAPAGDAANASWAGTTTYSPALGSEAHASWLYVSGAVDYVVPSGDALDFGWHGATTYSPPHYESLEFEWQAVGGSAPSTFTLAGSESAYSLGYTLATDSENFALYSPSATVSVPVRGFYASPIWMRLRYSRAEFRTIQVVAFYPAAFDVLGEASLSASFVLSAEAQSYALHTENVNAAFGFSFVAEPTASSVAFTASKGSVGSALDTESGSISFGSWPVFNYRSYVVPLIAEAYSMSGQPSEHRATRFMATVPSALQFSIYETSAYTDARRGAEPSVFALSGMAELHVDRVLEAAYAATAVGASQASVRPARGFSSQRRKFSLTGFESVGEVARAFVVDRPVYEVDEARRVEYTRRFSSAFGTRRLTFSESTKRHVRG